MQRGLQTCAGLFGPGKKWESYELNHNQKVVRVPIHVKKGDTVQVITGRDKGKVGEVQKVSHVKQLTILWLAESSPFACVRRRCSQSRARWL